MLNHHLLINKFIVHHAEKLKDINIVLYFVLCDFYEMEYNISDIFGFII
jgi:hypothetical protein